MFLFSLDIKYISCWNSHNHPLVTTPVCIPLGMQFPSLMIMMMMMMSHLLAISTSFLLYTSLVSTTCLLRNSATCLAGNSVSQT